MSSEVVSVDIIVVICPTLCSIRARPLKRSALRKIAPINCIMRSDICSHMEEQFYAHSSARRARVSLRLFIMSTT